jgi:hypothetical protein
VTPPLAPLSRSARLQAGGVMLLVLTTTNAILWLALLGWPLLGQIPLIWRLFVGIFANFYLLPFARAAGEKQLRRFQAKPTSSPIS